MQYFGYCGAMPICLPDTISPVTTSGLIKLNTFGGSYQNRDGEAFLSGELSIAGAFRNRKSGRHMA